MVALGRQSLSSSDRWLRLSTPQGDDARPGSPRGTGLHVSSSLDFTNFIIFDNICVCVCTCIYMGVCMTQGLHGGQRTAFVSRVFSSSTWVGLNSGQQAWQQACLPAEPSHWPRWILEAGFRVALASLKLI